MTQMKNLSPENVSTYIAIPLDPFYPSCFLETLYKVAKNIIKLLNKAEYKL